MVNQIKFSHNWNNKLGLKIFTTIRKMTPEKEKYYTDLIGKEFEVLLKGELFCKAELQSVEGVLFEELTDALIMYDTGMNLEDAQQLFSNFDITDGDSVLVLTFKVLEKEDDKRI